MGNDNILAIAVLLAITTVALYAVSVILGIINLFLKKKKIENVYCVCLKVSLVTLPSILIFLIWGLYGLKVTLGAIFAFLLLGVFNPPFISAVKNKK